MLSWVIVGTFGYGVFWGFLSGRGLCVFRSSLERGKGFGDVLGVFWMCYLFCEGEVFGTFLRVFRLHARSV